jgi:hypothetical protein
MRRFKTLFAGLAAASALGGHAAHADAIAGLYNTGETNALTAVSSGNDPHYVVLSSGAAARVTTDSAWAPDDGDSRWISVNDDRRPVPDTTYRTTFDLSGLDPSTASISGLWGADNDGYIFLNGVSTGISLTGAAGANFQLLHPFTIGSGFVAGLNTLDFEVLDYGGVTGLRVDGLTGTADVATATTAPEPATWLLAFVGFFGLGAALRQSRKVARSALRA